MNRFKVAAVQLNVKKKLDDVIKDMERYMTKARMDGVDIICFPECSLIASPSKNERLIKIIQKFCKNIGIWCITSGYLRAKKRIYNTAILINDKGEIHGKHKKVHVCDDITPYIKRNIRAGSSFEIFDTPFCKMGIAICWDIAFPAALETMAKKGAKIVFVPMYWVYEEWAHRKNHKKHEKAIVESLLLTRAFENLMYVVFCAAYNPERKIVVSYSGIAEPHKIITSIYDKEGMISAEVDLEYIKNMRRRYLKEYHKRV